MNRIQFPNPYGYPLPCAERVRELQNSYGFSDEFAEYLLTQNGFSLRKMADDAECDSHFAETGIHGTGDEGRFWQDIQLFSGVDAEDNHDNLVSAMQYNIFQGIFCPFGNDLGGNQFVEVLAGPWKGYIGCIDHEMYAGSDSLEQLANFLDLEGFLEMDLDQQAALLCDEESLGMMSFHAPSIKAFFAECIYCDDELNSYAISLIDEEDEGED